MKTNVDDYYDNSKNLPLKLEVEKLLKKFPIDFVAIFEKARQLTLKDASTRPLEYKQRNFLADNMYCNVIGLLYDNYPEFMQKDNHGRPYVVLSKNIRIYLKKLTKSHLPNNIKTGHVRQLNTQVLFNNDERVHVLYAGFVLNMNDWTMEFKDICISYINRIYVKMAAWVINLREEVYRKYAPIVTSLYTEQKEDESLVSVPRKQDGKASTL